MLKNHCLLLIVSLLISPLFVVAQRDEPLPINKKSPFYSDSIKDIKHKKLPYEFDDKGDNNTDEHNVSSPLFLSMPDNIKTKVVYDYETRNYYLEHKVGEHWVRRPRALSLKEYLQYDIKRSKEDFWFRRARDERQQYQYRLLSGIKFENKSLLKKVFGDGTLTFKAQGLASAEVGLRFSTIDNPSVPQRYRSHTSFFLNPRFSASVSGALGDILKMNINYDTGSTFSFSNKTKLEYSGDEDDIIKSIQAGNISLGLQNGLIRGGKDLFGVKADLQLGKLYITSVFSQQKGEIRTIDLKNGAKESKFTIDATNYDANRHFFLSKYFRNNYNKATENLPTISSDINIVRVEVWTTNITISYNKDEVRNLVGFVDLGENTANIHNPYFTTNGGVIPSNDTNNLYELMNTTYKGARNKNTTNTTLLSVPNFAEGKDFVKLETARKLKDNEFTFHPKLGFVSLRMPLKKNEIVAVAYEYIKGGKTYRVGEFSNSGPVAPNNLYVKLLKGLSSSPNLPAWDLMMKNIYSLGASNISSSNFTLDITYKNDAAGSLPLNYIDEGKIAGKPLLEVLRLDRLNSQLDPKPDGFFDFIEGTTFSSDRGLIIFPVLEPFGRDLRRAINDKAIADKYAFDDIYTKTESQLMQMPSKDKFQLIGTFSGGKGGDIGLGSFNIPKGAVVVYSGARRLKDGYDYIIDYMSGKVKIINPALLESSAPIHIETQDNSMFDLATKTLIGTDMTYRFNENAYLGTTFMYYKEQARRAKTLIGDEPVANFMWGIHGGYYAESDFLTRMLNKLPYYKTKEKVTIDVKGEFAQLIPGHNTLIGEGGNAYIDDFEGSRQNINLKVPQFWFLASTPENQPSLFPEGSLNNNLAYGYNRASLSWFTLDPDIGLNPYDNKADMSNPYVRLIKEKEIFPKKELEVGSSTLSNALTLHYDPTERGQYNFDVKGVSGISAGIEASGKLKNPKSRWAGIMRPMKITDFEANNVEYIEFWLLDPFINNDKSTGGELYFNLGEVSEDILKDSRKAFENGLPTESNDYKVDETVWGRVPNIQSIVNSFDNNDIGKQDLGLDGWDNEGEKKHFSTYLEAIANTPSLGNSSNAYKRALQDPANDDFMHFRNQKYQSSNASILERYSKYNHLQGNSISDNSATSFSSAYTATPDVEDINRDNTFNENEAYFQYRIQLSPSALGIGKNYIMDMKTVTATLPDGTYSNENWYQFKIPLANFQDKFGEIYNFRSIRFMRMYLRGFEEPVVLRFAKLNLVRASWRAYSLSLEPNKEGQPQNKYGTSFSSEVVSLVQNSTRQPINYIMPPSIKRELDPSYGQAIQMNEQAQVIKVKDLEYGDARAIFKRLNLDIRRYKRLVMDVHAEKFNDIPLDDNDMSVFIRLGPDFTDNYYEYEIPLKLTPPGFYKDTETERFIVWPKSNQFNIATDWLREIKLLRNRTQRNSSGIDYKKRFTVELSKLVSGIEYYQDNNILSIKGNPNLMNVRSLMIGVRNTSSRSSKESVEVWVNELRVSDFDNESGWAANLSISTQLSDLGSLSFSGQIKTAGFGGLNKSLNQRLNKNIINYDIAANLDFGKLLPEKARLQIPVYYNYSEYHEKPKYNELDPDIELDTSIENTAKKEEKNNIENASKTFVKTNSFSLTDVKVLPKEGENPKLWSLSNFSATYAQNETFRRDQNRAHDLDKNYKGVISYDYNVIQKPVMPFKKSKFFSTKYYKWIKNFNFYYLPSRISIRSEMNRHYRSIMRRNVINSNFITTPTFDSDFLWNRYYNIDYPITKSFKLSLSATNMSRVEEDYIRDHNDLYDVWKGIVWNSFRKGGRNVDYNHRVNFEYRLPLNYIPYMDWTKITLGYSAEYRWNAGPQFADNKMNIGNVISNQSTKQLGVNFDFVGLYRNSQYLKAIDQTYSSKNIKIEKPKRKRYTQDIKLLKSNKYKLITHNFGTRSVSLKVYDKYGKLVGASKKVVNKNRIRIRVNKTLRNARVELTGVTYPKRPIMTSMKEGLWRILMSVRNINIDYNKTEGSTLQGFLPTPSYFGMKGFSFNGAPGLGFVLGNQDNSFLDKAVKSNYLVKNSLVNQPFIMTTKELLNINGTIQPINSLRITLNANREYFDNVSYYYEFGQSGNFVRGKKIRSGNLSMSYISLKSSFFDINKQSTYNSSHFKRFLSARKRISKQLAKDYYGNSYLSKYNSATGYYEGFGGNSQDVMIRAFHEEYGGRSNKGLPSIWSILPNWKLNFSGLNDITLFNNIFRNISLQHSYQSRYVVGGYQTNLEYGDKGKVNMRGDFIPKIEINSVTIDEKFSPLLGINMDWKNNLTTNLSINRGHLAQLNIGSGTLTETSNNEWVFKVGYRFNNLRLFVGKGANSRKFNNNLRILAGFTLRKDNTVLRQIGDGNSQITSGQESILYNLSADYALSKSFNVRLFYDRTVRNPYISNSFPTIISNIGVSVRFNFTDFEKKYNPFVSKKKLKKKK